MGYEVHIKRVGRPISLDEWRKAVGSVQGTRLLHGDVAISSAGGEIVLPNNGGDAEVYTPQSKWVFAFRWRPSGDITFRGTPEFDDPRGLLRAKAMELAVILDAQVIGDDGEIYE